MTKEQEELLLLGRALDNGVGSMPDDIWESYLERYEGLEKIVHNQNKQRDEQRRREFLK